jgi:hypothetical protein
VNWASALELALRSISWVWAMHFLLADVSSTDEAGRPIAGSASAWCVDLLVALDRQLVHVEQNLSYYFSPNTHLTGEALALYVAGTALPELQRGSRWRQLGRQILLREIGRQIGADGGHVERSTHYHRYTLDIYLCALLTAQQAGDTGAAARFRDAAAKLAAFMQAMADDSGWLPLIGDDDGGMLWPMAGRDPRDVRDSLALARAAIPDAPLRPWPAVEEVRWIAGRAAPDEEAARRGTRRQAPDSGALAFPGTGFVTMRTGHGDHLTFDVGPHGYLNGGHAHADALSITLTAAGRPLLIDPGTATYTMDRELRDRMRHSASHNTLTLNGRSSAVPHGPFHWRSRADARLHACRSARAFGFAEAWHDGYGASVHCRSVLQAPGEGWLILDEIVGTGTHAAELHWLFDPCWEVTERTGGLLATADGARVWLLHDGHHVTLARGDAERGLGWCSPRYGVVTPAWAARISRPVMAPAALATWIGRADESEPPVLDRPPVEADGGARAAAVRVRHRHRTLVALLRPQDEVRRATRRAGTSDYHTDARVLLYVTGAGALNVSLADGTRALALHGGPISLAAPEPLEAVHVAASGERLEIWAPVPPAVIHLQGRMLREVRRVVLNGREAPAPPRRSADTLTCEGGDWGDGRAALVERQPLLAAAPPAAARASALRAAHIAG